jgi:hypothetical protein
MRVRSLVNVRIFESTNERDLLFGPSVDDATVIMDTYNEAHSGRFQVAAAGTISLGLGSLQACRGCFIRAFGDFDLSVNGGAVIQVRRRPSAAATDMASFYVDGVVTSISVTNTSATAVLGGYFAMWGDPT